jgi:hypothetical protein
MALEATHIRFALDTKDFFDVKDVDKYISGSIYPDSRYPTGIDRMLTHDDSQMARDFWQDNDFRKGWACHLLYDKIQFSVHADWFKDFLKENNPEMTGEEDWIVRTALKILQDIDDLRHFDIKSYLNALNYIETPNGEDKIKVKEYNQLFINIYNKAPMVSVEDLEQMWVDWSIPTEIAVKMCGKAHEMQKDERLMQLISKIYDETIARKDEFFNRYCI